VNITGRRARRRLPAALAGGSAALGILVSTAALAQPAQPFPRPGEIRPELPPPAEVRRSLERASALAAALPASHDLVYLLVAAGRS
jgi:hypothetical protein